jgi:hypothetical protein
MKLPRQFPRSRGGLMMGSPGSATAIGQPLLGKTVSQEARRSVNV